MPFGIIGRTNPGMRQVVGFGDRSAGGTFRGEFLARYCNHAIGTLRRTCATVPRPSSQINLGKLVIIDIVYSLYRVHTKQW